MIRIPCLIVLFATLAACGSETLATSRFGGQWSEVSASGQKGMTLEFRAETGKLVVHTAPDESGGHDHLQGTYSFDPGTSLLTVQCDLAGKGKGGTWTGKAESDHLTLTAGSASLKFQKAEAGHGDKK